MRRLIGGLPGVPDKGLGEGLGLDDVSRCTGWFSGRSEGTLCDP